MVRLPRFRVLPARRSNRGQDVERAEEEAAEDRFLASGLCLAPLFISGAAACLASVSRTHLCTALTVPAYRSLALAGAALMALFLLRVTLSAWKYGRSRSGVFWPAAGVSLMVVLLTVWSVSLGAALFRCSGAGTG